MRGTTKIATPNRVPLNERHKPWWQRCKAADKTNSTSSNDKPKRNVRGNVHQTGSAAVLHIPKILAEPNIITTTGRRPKSATSTRRHRREYAVGAPPYRSSFTGREVPSRISHDIGQTNVTNSKAVESTTAAVLGNRLKSMKKNYKRRPQSAVVRRRGGSMHTVNKTTSIKKEMTFKSPVASNIVRRYSSSRGRSLKKDTTTRRSNSSNNYPANQTSHNSSTTFSSHHASLGGPYTRSDPRIFGASVDVSNPSDAAIYAVQGTPRERPLTAIELGRNQVQDRALQKIPPKQRGEYEGHTTAALFGDELRSVKNRIPTPAPQSLDKVHPDLQKAVLWPEHIVERSNWPKEPKNIQKVMMKSNEHDRKLSKEEYVYKLCRACRLKDYSIVENILNYEGIEWINETGTDGSTALHHAASGGAARIVYELLLPNGADPTIETDYIGTPLDVAEARLNRLQRMAPPQKLLNEEPSHQLLVNLLQTTSIWQACQLGDLPRVKHLIEFQGIDEENFVPPIHTIDEPNRYGCTPLHYACMKEQAHIISYLLDQGASTKLKNNLGQLPCDVTNSTWVHDKLSKEMTDRRAKIKEREDYYKQMECLQQAQESRDRSAWIAARGTSSAVPLAERLKKHQENHVKLRNNRNKLRNEFGRDVNVDSSSLDILPSNGSQKRGVFAGEPTNKGRYLLAKPGSAHTTKELAKKGLPSQRISDDRKTPMEGTSRLRHIR
jgi:hypothetical protein